MYSMGDIVQVNVFNPSFERISFLILNLERVLLDCYNNVLLSNTTIHRRHSQIFCRHSHEASYKRKKLNALRSTPSQLPHIVANPSLHTGTKAVGIDDRGISISDDPHSREKAYSGAHYFTRILRSQSRDPGSSSKLFRHLQCTYKRLHLVTIRDPANDEAFPVLPVQFRGVSTPIQITCLSFPPRPASQVPLPPALSSLSKRFD